MSFELAEPGRGGFPRLPVGSATMHKSGKLSFTLEDMRRIGLGPNSKAAATLVDPGTWRVAIRPKRDGERGFALTGKGLTRGVAIGSVLRRIGIDPQKVAGRYEVTLVDDMLIIILPRPKGGRK